MSDGPPPSQRRKPNLLAIEARANLSLMLFSSVRFIQPCQPTLRVIPPSGEQWLHEVKFDGWRIQLQKAGRHVALYTKNGHDFSRVFRHLAKMLAALPVRSAVIDGELAACDDRGVPDFRALHFRDIEDDQLCVWAFDILHLDGNDLRPLPLVERKHLLGKLVYKTGVDWLRLSEPFNDGAKLLRRPSAWVLKASYQRSAMRPTAPARATGSR